MKNLFLFLSLLVCSVTATAQLIASNDTSICRGRSVSLSVTGGSNYVWTPAASLTNANTANPTATPSQTTTYVVTSQLQLPNQFFNGDFSLGNVGFTSSYIYTLPPNFSGQGRYWVGGNPNLFSSGMANCPDHTGGADTNQIIANGAQTLLTPLWCQTVSVYPNTTYSLSGWIQTLNQTNLPKARWMVDGVPVGNSANTFLSCLWLNFTATWNSGIQTSANFCAYSVDTFANGNDFAMDDFSLTATVNLTDTVVVTVLDNPLLNLGADTLLCSGSNLILDAGNPGAAYLWNDNTTAQTLSASNGSYAVTVTGTNGCTATDAVNVSSYSLSITPTVVNTNCGFNNGQMSIAVNNGTGPFDYQWSDNTTGTSITNVPAGDYSVTVSDAAGCSASVSATINPSGGGTINITADKSTICASDSAFICAPVGFNAYLWNTGQSGNCIYAKVGGNYYVTVTDNANCTSLSNPIAVAVYPVPSVSVSVNGDTLKAFNANSYQWYKDGFPIIGADASQYVANQSGNYSVLITDTNGCVASSNSIPVVTGINTRIQDASVQVYPNPNTDGRWILSADKYWVGNEYTLHDMQGRLVLQSKIRTELSEIQINQGSGIYFLQIKAGENTVVRKLIHL